ncbi:MAG: PAS domain S-box protein, partial [Polyangiaceae bacterium]|nr:PAS domain S-box protein [Polyangiaceae bacterium]
LRTKSGAVLKGFCNLDAVELFGAPHVLTAFHDATEVLAARDALEESEAKYRLLAEASPEMVYLVDGEGIIRYVNGAAARMFGDTPEHVMGRSLAAVYPPAIAARHLGVIRHVMATGAYVATEVEEVFPTGRCWIDARLSPVRDEHGGIRAVLGLSQDISGRKRAEARTVAQRDLGLALGNAPDLATALSSGLEAALAISDTDAGGIYLVEPHDGGLHLQCHTNLSAEFVAHASLFPADSASARIAMAGRSVYTHFDAMPAPRFAGRAAEGLRAVAVVPFHHEQRVVGCLNVASHRADAIPDETRIALESAAIEIGNAVGRLQAEEALRASEERFRGLFEQASFGMALAHEGLGFVKVNAALQAMLHYSAEELGARSLGDVARVPGVEPLLARAERLRRGDAPAFQASAELVRKDGAALWSELTLSVLRGPAGGFLHFLVVVEDVAERRRMEEELQRTQRLDALGVLAGGIAHDFNNLLAGVFGFIDLARSALPQGERAAEHLGSALVAFERARGLSSQLLTFAKGGTPRKSTVALEGLLRDACNLALCGSSARSELDVPADLRAVEADPHQLGQVFSNVLINARQAMPQGGRVSVRAENRELDGAAGAPLPAGAYVLVSVSDEGVGIPGAIIDRVFDPFFTTKPHGTGLGLSITYSIVKRHDGHVALTSTPGVGTTVSVWLPAAAGAARASVAPAPLASERGAARVLFMDDDAIMRKLAEAVLGGAGHHVVSVSDGAAALGAFEAAHGAGTAFDLAILDLTIAGGMGGIETLAALRRLAPELPVCVSSGYADNDVLESFAAHGFAAALPKPYRAADLLRVVERARR